jgi:sulfite reductase (NADPH) flavoprotein alpha-component
MPIVEPYLLAASNGWSAPGPTSPFAAPVLANLVLTGPRSSGEKRHIEFGLEGSGLTYSPGDALAIVPRNDARLVETVLARLGISESTCIRINGRPVRIGDALATQFEIAGATPRFLRCWASLSGSSELQTIALPENTEARRQYLRANHLQDIVRSFPVAGLNADEIAACLRPLQPRLYSIASSPSVDPTRAAITTSTLSYRLHGELRRGAVTGYQIPTAKPGSSLSVFIEPDPQFRLSDGTDIIMIAAGTGIAPFRAFVAECRTRVQSRRAWLFFGTRTRSDDFLYEQEWQRALDDGSLTRMDVAFSRDLDRKFYVQHRLLEHGPAVYAWIEGGASVYVCGDAATMAPAVHQALVEIVMGQGRIPREQAIEYLRRMARDRRYCRSIY